MVYDRLDINIIYHFKKIWGTTIPFELRGENHFFT